MEPLGWGNKSSYKGSRSLDQDGQHAAIAVSVASQLQVLLHTTFVRVRVPLAANVFQNTNKPIKMYVVWRMRWFHKNIPGCQGMYSVFPPPQTALDSTASGKGACLSSTSDSPRQYCIWEGGLSFLHLRQPSTVLHLGRGLLVEWCSNGE